MGIWVVMLMNIQMVLQSEKNCLLKDMTFLEKSNSERNKVEKLTVAPMSYEGLNEDEEVEIVLAHDENNDNNHNIVIVSESDDEVKENLFEVQMEEDIKVTSKMTLNP